MSKAEILQNSQVDTRVQELKDIHEDIEMADTKVAFSLFFLFNLPRVFLAIARIGILYFIWYRVFTWDFSITDFIFSMTILLMFETFLIDSIETYKNFTKDFTDVEKLWETIDNGPLMKWYSTWTPFSPKPKNIEINSISYGYNETKVFDDFSLTIERGKKTALVWASGGGKTTLMKLIAGYLHPEKGYISVLGNKLDETALKSYYPHIGYLTQDPGVFDATIRENLISAIREKKTDTQAEDTKEKDSVSETKKKNTNLSSVTVSLTQDEMLERALKLAQCDFVFEMEKWLDTEIGERGVRLSGWQKQRLAIAKIFLKNPEIILLDEPTSALDSFSEEKITEALDILFKNRTVIIIAHRLQTVKKADDIIVIEGGAVVERGDHEELVAKWGIYHKMLELQSGF
jgi:ABC-type multidrug transport system fused ATPase/permease subunit